MPRVLRRGWMPKLRGVHEGNESLWEGQGPGQGEGLSGAWTWYPHACALIPTLPPLGCGPWVGYLISLLLSLHISNLSIVNNTGFRNLMWRLWWLLHCSCPVAQSCLTLCNPMDRNTSGFPVLRRLPELAQTHVHWVDDASIIDSTCIQCFPNTAWQIEGFYVFSTSTVLQSEESWDILPRRTKK